MHSNFEIAAVGFKKTCWNRYSIFAYLSISLRTNDVIIDVEFKATEDEIRELLNVLEDIDHSESETKTKVINGNYGSHQTSATFSKNKVVFECEGSSLSIANFSIKTFSDEICECMSD
jgi:hypothetical protein